jgi:hypothetical protein
MNEEATYSSTSTVKSLWQEYRIYNDRVEFDTHFGTMIIPLAHVERVDVSESEIRGLLRGDLHLRNFRPALKLDWANFLEHVVLDKSTGWVRRILFTPDNPVAFTRALDEALSRYREREAPRKG